MTDKRRQAFVKWVTSAESGIPAGSTWDAIEVMEAWQVWQAACEWMAQPPQPTEGALVLDGEFFKRK